MLDWELVGPDFEDNIGLAVDVLNDQRDIAALTEVADAIHLRNRLNIGGKIGALGPVELARLCDYVGSGDRAKGVELIQAARALVGSDFVCSLRELPQPALEEHLDRLEQQADVVERLERALSAISSSDRADA